MSHRKLEPGKLVVASHNKGKIREINELLQPYGFEVISAGELDLPEPDETGVTFEENAAIKAHAAAKASRLPALADDSGFCVAALNGDPGIYSARWAGPDKDFAMAMRTIEESFRPWAQDGRQAPGIFCRRVVPGLAGRQRRVLPRRGRGTDRLAAARYAGLRLRPGFPAGWP